jgi:hypothetical protein
MKFQHVRTVVKVSLVRTYTTYVHVRT